MAPASSALPAGRCTCNSTPPPHHFFSPSLGMLNSLVFNHWASKSSASFGGFAKSGFNPRLGSCLIFLLPPSRKGRNQKAGSGDPPPHPRKKKKAGLKCGKGLAIKEGRRREGKCRGGGRAQILLVSGLVKTPPPPATFLLPYMQSHEPFFFFKFA